MDCLECKQWHSDHSLTDPEVGYTNRYTGKEVKPICHGCENSLDGRARIDNFQEKANNVLAHAYRAWTADDMVQTKAHVKRLYQLIGQLNIKGKRPGKIIEST